MFNNKLKNIDINKIQANVNQPRTVFNEAKIDELLSKNRIKLPKTGMSLEEKVYLLFSETVEKELIHPTFITGFPIEVSPLAKRDADNPGLAARAELFVAGLELANLFNELNDPFDQAERFHGQVVAREAGDVEAHAFDADFILALEHALPPTVGFGIGIDRFVMLLTGTPPRVEINSIDYSKTSLQPGTNAKLAFSFTTDEYVPIEKQTPCYLTYTNETTHKIIHDNLEKCAMYSGLVKGIGPRYCPSIEDKVVKFSDKPQHQIFLEPESKEMNSIYVQGFSTSMPHDIQEQMIRTLPGLENCTILKYAYAIEYDAIDPLQLWPSLETKVIKNLFTAGQINGTSGYEEAAGQGLMAGINATLKVRNEAPLVLKRDEAYIGVMIDDLVTKGTKEPYRMLTSRAEYRLLIRHDNADERLYDYSHKIGLVKDKEYQRYQNKMKGIYDEIERLSTIRFTPKDDINEMLEQNNSSHLKEGVSAKELITRPEISYDMMLPYIDAPELSEEQRRRITILIKYAGYIEKAKRQAQKQIKMEEKHIPEDIDYEDVKNLALEAKQKLSEIRPLTIGQASRISGINPADISVLLIYLKQKYNGE